MAESEFRELPPLSGDEPVAPDATVRDFWPWALGDLRLTSTRGMLAQFLVARAVGDPRPGVEGWGDYDVETPDGVRIEVKASGYLQSWKQTTPSKIVFKGLKARAWSEDTDGWGSEPEFRADVYVFVVHGCTHLAAYDPLDLAARRFYVLPASVLRTLNQKTLTLPRLETLAPPPVPWAGLRDAIEQAAVSDNETVG